MFGTKEHLTGHLTLMVPDTFSNNGSVPKVSHFKSNIFSDFFKTKLIDGSEVYNSLELTLLALVP
jgi:hypothetical protein